MERFDTRVFLIAASVLVAGCGGGGGGGATQTVAAPQQPAAPSGNSALQSSQGKQDPTDMMDLGSEEAAAKDGYEAGLEYGQAKAEAASKGEDPPERPENPFLESGQTLDDDEVDRACKKVGDEVEPTEEAMGDDEPEEEGTDEGTEEESSEENSEETSEDENKGYNVEDAGQTAGDDEETSESASASDTTSDTASDDGETSEDGETEEDDAEAEADDAEEDDDAEQDGEGDEDVELDAETKRRLAAIWECAFKQGTEAGEVIFEEGALGDAGDSSGGIGTEEDNTGETNEGDEDEPGDEPEEEPADEAASCGDGSEYAPIAKVEAEVIDGTLKITAEGKVPTGGYTHAKLMETTQGLDADGVLHLVFCVTPPADDAAVIQAFQDISADLNWTQDVEKVERVIVEGRNASKQRPVQQSSEEGGDD